MCKMDRQTDHRLVKINTSGCVPVMGERRVDQVAGVIIVSGGGRSSSRVQPQRQRGHAQIFGRGVRTETAQVLLWYSAGGHAMGHLPGQAATQNKKNNASYSNSPIT